MNKNKAKEERLNEEMKIIKIEQSVQNQHSLK